LLTKLAALGTRQWFLLRGTPPWVQEAFLRFADPENHNSNIPL
jgi:hypothetical protein